MSLVDSPLETVQAEGPEPILAEHETMKAEPELCQKEPVQVERAGLNSNKGRKVLTRIETMRLARCRLADDRKKKEFRNDDIEKEIDTLRAKAGTTRGARLLRSKDARSEEIQDKTKPMEIVGADVESLYPSLDDKTVADLVYKAIIESEIKFANVNYKEAVRYLALI